MKINIFCRDSIFHPPSNSTCFDIQTQLYLLIQKPAHISWYFYFLSFYWQMSCRVQYLTCFDLPTFSTSSSGDFATELLLFAAVSKLFSVPLNVIRGSSALYLRVICCSAPSLSLPCRHVEGWAATLPWPPPVKILFSIPTCTPEPLHEHTVTHIMTQISSRHHGWGYLTLFRNRDTNFQTQTTEWLHR